MSELKRYLELSNQARQDTNLMHLMQAYDQTVASLNGLLEQEDYDAAEAIRLTNDAEYLAAEIAKNDLYQSLAEAKNALNHAIANRAGTFVCGCNCAACQSKCQNAESEAEQ